MTTILIAEDDAQLRRFYKMALESKGYEIIGLAKDGEEALDIFKNLNKKPDLIILDHRMPIKNGLQTLNEILSLEKSSKVVFASADSKIKQVTLSKGAKMFLEKPFSLEALYESIARLENDTVDTEKISIANNVYKKEKKDNLFNLH